MDKWLIISRIVKVVSKSRKKAGLLYKILKLARIFKLCSSLRIEETHSSRNSWEFLVMARKITKCKMCTTYLFAFRLSCMFFKKIRERCLFMTSKIRIVCISSLISRVISHTTSRWSKLEFNSHVYSWLVVEIIKLYQIACSNAANL